MWTALPLGADDLFEISVEEWAAQWAGALAIGLTCMPPSDKAPPVITAIKEPTWFIMGNIAFNTYSGTSVN